MSEELAALNRLSREEAIVRLRGCCASDRWAAAMAARRPFADLEEILQACDRVWSELGPDDWRDAIDHHPRLGSGNLRDSRFAATRSHSASEQARLQAADSAERAALARAQTAYERRFGCIFLTCAAGKTANQILEEISRRMENEPDIELAVATEELKKITRLRLARLFGGETTPESR